MAARPKPDAILLPLAAVIAAVLLGAHRARALAHRVGEPSGSLILALAVVVIELALVVSVMLCGGAASTWPREPLSVAIIVLMTLTLLASTIALASGCSTLLHAAAHMVLFGAFLFLVVVP